MATVDKVVLAYSGGLDTSVIVRWLQQTYDCEVVTFTADIGQGEEVEPARAKAQALGVEQIYIEICASLLCGTSFFPCSVRIRFMRVSTFWAHQLRALNCTATG